MKPLLKVLILSAFIFLLKEPCFAFSISNPFNKKYDKEQEIREPMVHTVEEWMESATSLKMDMRKREENKKENEKYIPPSSRPLFIKRYNLKAGSRELDLTNIYKTKNVRSIFVSDPSFKNAVYTEVYYYPQTRQIASAFYMIELDSNLGKKERLNDVSIFEHTRYPLISTALPYLKEGMFSTLTAVDFSSDGKMVLVKERRGSNKFGLYETYVWIYYFTDKNREYNTCYMNNVSFSNEISTFDGLDGRNIRGKSNNENNPDFKNGVYNNYNLDNLSNVPSSKILPNGIYGREAFGGNIKAIQDNDTNNGFSSFSQGDYNPDTSWLKEGVTNLDKDPNEKYKLKEKDMPKLDYKQVRNFIKAVWKYDAMTSPTKTRWYNKIPVDFRVDDNYVSGRENIGFGVRLNLLNEMIKAYWFDRRSLILNHIRWDLNPLGFSASNKDEIIVDAWCYTKDGKEVSLGRWAVNVQNGLPRLVSDNEKIQIEANGFFVEEKLNP